MKQRTHTRRRPDARPQLSAFSLKWRPNRDKSRPLASAVVRRCDARLRPSWALNHQPCSLHHRPRCRLHPLHRLPRFLQARTWLLLLTTTTTTKAHTRNRDDSSSGSTRLQLDCTANTIRPKQRRRQPKQREHQHPCALLLGRRVIDQPPHFDQRASASVADISLAGHV